MVIIYLVSMYQTCRAIFVQYNQYVYIYIYIYLDVTGRRRIRKGKVPDDLYIAGKHSLKNYRHHLFTCRYLNNTL